MSAMDLVIFVLILIGTAVAMVLTTVAVSSLVQAHRIRLEPLLGDARQAIVTALSGADTPADGAFTGLTRFSERYIVAVMLDLAPSVTGTSRSVLVSLGEEIGILQRARAGVRRRRWWTRLYSARVLTAFGVESEQLCALLIDRSPEVRAQAAAWSVTAPSPATIDRLIDLLGDRDGLCRFAAQDALIRIGLPCSEALKNALAAADDDVTPQLLTVAAAMGDERFSEPAECLISHPSPSTRALATAVLARSGGPNAGPALVRLLDDPSDQVVLAAAAGIAKLSYWPAAPHIERILSNPSWELRRQAGMTLIAIGAAGTVLLRANAPGEGVAADMAVQALQLQSLASQSGAA